MKAKRFVGFPYSGPGISHGVLRQSILIIDHLYNKVRHIPKSDV